MRGEAIFRASDRKMRSLSMISPIYRRLGVSSNFIREFSCLSYNINVASSKFSPVTKTVNGLGPELNLGPFSKRAISLSSCKIHIERNTQKRDLAQGNGFILQRYLKNSLSENRYFSNVGNSQKNQQRKEDLQGQDLVEAKASDGQITVGQKVKQAGKDASYTAVLFLGFGITAVLIWYVASELLFSFSPNSVYTKALKIVKNNESVQEAIGSPMKAYGEETSRGRRRHVSHQEYIVDGANFMRVKFYVAGSKRKGTVHVDTKETSRGQFEFRYIFVELDGYPPETIIVEDRR